MRVWLRACAAVLSIAMPLAVGACSDPDPSPTPTATPSVSATTPSSSPTESVKPVVDTKVSAAVLTAYRGYWAARVTAQAHPTKPIPKELATFAVDKAAADVASSVTLFRQQGIEVRGEPALSPTVVSVSSGDPATASITDCVDSAHWLPVFVATGKSALPAGQPTRVVVESTASTYAGRWVIRTSSAFRDRTC